MKWNHQWAQGEAWEVFEQKDPLAFFKQKENTLEVTPDMKPEEVANIWSDKLMQLISRQMGNKEINVSL